MKYVKETLVGLAFCVATAAAMSNPEKHDATPVRFVPQPYPNVTVKDPLFKAGPVPVETKPAREPLFKPRTF